MADALIPDHEADVPIFPVAPRLTHPDRPTPYVGPAIPDYRAVHRQTVGNDSDEWWAKVRISALFLSSCQPELTTNSPHRNHHHNGHGRLFPVPVPVNNQFLFVVTQTARELLYWHRPFHTVRSGSFKEGDIAWFIEGGLNASYNCVDRWAHADPDRVRCPQI